MIKAIANTKEGRKILIMGLSDLNVEKLTEGKPIHFDLEPLGMEGAIVILHGKTEDDISADILRHFSTAK